MSDHDALSICGASEGFEIEAEANPADGKPALKKFRMVAYTGVAMRIGFFTAPVVVDLAGLKVPSQKRPVLRDHQSDRIVGHTEVIEVTEGGTRLKMAGVISGVGSDTAEVLALSANNFPWNSSIGASVERMEFVDRDQTVKVNGRSFSGPVYVARATTLGEVSFVAMGADPATSASVAAQRRGDLMSFEQWLEVKGFGSHTLTDAQKQILQLAWKAETQPPPVAQPIVTPPLPPTTQAARTMQDVLAAARAEEQREGAISEQIARAIEAHPGQLEEWELVGQLALKEKWDASRVELEVLRRARPRVGGYAVGRSEAPAAEDVIEAGFCLHAGLQGIEQHYPERTLEAARKRWRNGLSIGELLMTCAQRNGYRGTSYRSGLADILRYAFNGIEAAGSTSPSYHNLASGLLANIANKFVRVAFEAVDPSWRMITATRSVSDFKTITTYSLTGDLTYDLVPPGGEIKHGTLGAETYTIRADTYGKMFALDRRDLINDDTGALSRIATRLGRGGALKLNKIFWAEYLDNGTFFTAGRLNAFTGAGTALSITSLAQADAAFRVQTDPDGNPLGLMPRILLVPPALRIAALNLVASELTAPDSTGTTNTTPGTMFPNRNPFAGAYSVVSSPYMSDTTLTGNSTTAWYLLASPDDMPVIEVAFLNGQQSPTVESADADFGTLGIAWRGFHDFGTRKQEYRAGTRMAGA